MRQRRPRGEDKEHRRFIASCPCLICGRNDVQCAHISYADLSVGKRFTGMGEKADDKYTVPLCLLHHDAQHRWGNESDWWARHEVDPIKVALALFAVSGNLERAEEIIRSARDQMAA